VFSVEAGHLGIFRILLHLQVACTELLFARVLGDAEVVEIGLRAGADRVALQSTVRDALSQLIAHGGKPLTVVDGGGEVKGILTLEVLGAVLADGGLGDAEESG